MRDAESFLVLFPGALGDFVCLWPTLRALERRHPRATLIARPSFFELLDAGRWRFVSIDRREIAELYGSGAISRAARALLGRHARILSWSGAGDERFAARLREAGGGDVSVLPFRGMRPGEHAAAYYARCAGVPLERHPLEVGGEAQEWAEQLWRRHGLGDAVLAVHPGSGDVRKNWMGMGEITARWRREGGRVVVLQGPAEDERGVNLPGDLVVREESLVRVAAVLRRARFYLGNDSGVSHLAAVAGARGLALFGPSDPATWRPLGDRIEVLARERACGRCGVFCVHELDAGRVWRAVSARGGLAGKRAL